MDNKIEDFLSRQKNTKKKEPMNFKRSEGRHPGTGEPFVDYTFRHGEGEAALDFTVRATAEGVQIFGKSTLVRDNYELEPFGRALGQAFRSYIKLEMELKKNPFFPSIPGM